MRFVYVNHSFERVRDALKQNALIKIAVKRVEERVADSEMPTTKLLLEWEACDHAAVVPAHAG